MAQITRFYMKNHDMDIFFCINGIPIHIATNGCIIPKYFADIKKQKQLFTKIRQIEPNQENKVLIANETFLRNIINESYLDSDSTNFKQLEDSTIEITDSKLNLYCQSFYHFSERGLYSFDYSHKTNSFYLVTKPTVLLADEDILKLMPNNPYVRDFDIQNIDQLIDIKFFEEID